MRAVIPPIAISYRKRKSDSASDPADQESHITSPRPMKSPRNRPSSHTRSSYRDEIETSLQFKLPPQQAKTSHLRSTRDTKSADVDVEIGTVHYARHARPGAASDQFAASPSRHIKGGKARLHLEDTRGDHMDYTPEATTSNGKSKDKRNSEGKGKAKMGENGYKVRSSIALRSQSSSMDSQLATVWAGALDNVNNIFLTLHSQLEDMRSLAHHNGVANPNVSGAPKPSMAGNDQTGAIGQVDTDPTSPPPARADFGMRRSRQNKKKLRLTAVAVPSRPPTVWTDHFADGISEIALLWVVENRNDIWRHMRNIERCENYLTKIAQEGQEFSVREIVDWIRLHPDTDDEEDPPEVNLPSDTDYSSDNPDNDEDEVDGDDDDHDEPHGHLRERLGPPAIAPEPTDSASSAPPCNFGPLSVTRPPPLESCRPG